MPIKNILIHESIERNFSFNRIKKINVVNDDEYEVKKRYLNIIPISLAKCLEFEQVYIITNNMTQNENMLLIQRR